MSEQMILGGLAGLGILFVLCGMEPGTAMVTAVWLMGAACMAFLGTRAWDLVKAKGKED